MPQILCKMGAMESEFRRLPGVDKVLADERVRRAGRQYPHERLVAVVREQLEQERKSIMAGKKASSFDGIVDSVLSQLASIESVSLRPLINATGVILHTNLGRAPLSREAIAAMESVSRGYSNLEFDLESGARGSRQVHVEALLCQLTGAEAALVVNNNAAAVLLGLTALARRKEVIVSRGQAVEIGGGFRIPDVMRQSGAKLVEVGTTNITRPADYEQAITSRTAGLLRVHSSNFKVVGFTGEVSLEELVAVGKKHNLPVLDDVGSGCFLDTAQFGLAPEPVVQKSIAEGASLVFFSGDKLMGGPQAGLIVGKRELVDKLRKHPLARAMRIDKIRLAGLAATLVHYWKGEALTRIPVWQMISAPIAGIEKRAKAWTEAIGKGARVIDDESMVGGGSLPGGTLLTKLVALGSKENPAMAKRINQQLRRQKVPVIGRISDDVLLLDPRSVLPEEDETVLSALKEIASALK